MLRHVTPADPKATIPDPEHGDALPPAGRTVAWTPYWAGLLAREDVTVGEPLDADAPELPPAPVEAPAAGKPPSRPGTKPEA